MQTRALREHQEASQPVEICNFDSRGNERTSNEKYSNDSNVSPLASELHSSTDYSPEVSFEIETPTQDFDDGSNGNEISGGSSIIERDLGSAIIAPLVKPSRVLNSVMSLLKVFIIMLYFVSLQY